MSHDDHLKNAVLAELIWEPTINSAHIGVTAANGTVTLTGTVDSYAQKQAAETATGRVKGVKAIAEEIDIKLPYEVKHSDADIAAAAVNRLAWDSSLPRDAVKVKAEKGWVTLTGEVEWHYQMEAAEREVRHLMGVIAVVNKITIKSRVDTANLQDDIQRALHRSIFFQPERVHVSANDGRIKLTGTVDSWTERQTAGSTAWAAQGATSVENNLIVA